MKGHSLLRSPSYFWTDNLERKMSRPWGDQLQNLKNKLDLHKEHASTTWNDDPIDIDTKGKTNPGSPPDLMYLIEEGTSGTTVDTPDPMMDIQENLHDEEKITTDKEEVKPEEKDDGKKEDEAKELKPTNEIKEILCRSVSNLDFLTSELDWMKGKDQESIAGCMAQLGLLQVWYNLGKAKLKGQLTESDYWKGQVVKALVEKEAVVESLLAIKVDEPEVKEELMDTHQDTNHLALIHANKLADWYPDVEIEPYAPASLNPEDPPKTPYIPMSPELTELDEVKNWIFALEDQVDSMT